MKCPCCGKDGYAPLTQSELKRRLFYEPATGDFTWIMVGRPSLLGKKAGLQTVHPYVSISVLGKRYYAHRLAWLYMTGSWPPDYVDHINGNSADNRWENLRSATARQNIANSRRSSGNTSGFKGVSWHRYSKLWRATINIDGKQKHLGNFADPKEAHDAYCQAALKQHGHFMRRE